MGLQQRSATPRIYVQYNARSGKLVTTEKVDGQKVKTEHDSISGVIQNLTITEDDYEGQPRYDLNVHMTDGEARYQVTFNADTRQALELMGRMNAADIGHPLLIGGYSLPAGEAGPDGKPREQEFVGVTLRQGEGFKTKIDPFYSPELNNKQPKAVMLVDDNGAVVKVKGVEQLDKEATKLQRQQLIAQLMGNVLGQLNALKQGAKQGDEGVDAATAAAAAGEADRSAMRARG